MWGVLLIALPFTYITKAETSNSFAGHWYVWEENVNVSGNQWISYQNVLFVTNDPTAMGQVQVNNTTSGPSNFIQTLDFSGTYTFYSHLFEQPFTVAQGLMPVATSNSRAFTSYTPIQSASNIEIVELSSSQIQSLINSIQSASSYDDTTLLTQLAIIKGVLDNIDTSSSSSATDIASLLNTSNSILNALNNIDNALDTITWNVQTVTPVVYDSSFNVVNDHTYIQGGTYYITYPLPTNNENLGIFERAINYYSTGNQFAQRFSFELGALRLTDNKFFNNGAIIALDNTYYGRYNLLFCSDIGYTSNTFVFCVKVVAKAVFAVKDNITLKTIGHDDIEYWTLKAYLEQHLYYQNEYPELTEEQSDFNEELDDYLDAEDDLISDFQSAISDPSISPSIPAANPSNWGNIALNSIAFIGLIFNTLTGFTLGGNVFYQMIQFSLMFGLALLIIGKRAL